MDLTSPARSPKEVLNKCKVSGLASSGGLRPADHDEPVVPTQSSCPSLRSQREFVEHSHKAFVVLSISSSMGDEGFSYPPAPGKPGSGSVSASEVTSGAGVAVVDSTSTGAGICTGGRIVIGRGGASGVVPLSDSIDADSGTVATLIL